MSMVMSYTVYFATPCGTGAGCVDCDSFADAQKIAEAQAAEMPSDSQVYIVHPDGSETEYLPR